MSTQFDSEQSSSEITSPKPDGQFEGTNRPRTRLRGSLGVWGIVFIVAAAASPLGVMGGTVPIGISIGDGTGFPGIFIIGTVLLLLFAVGFTALTPYVPNAGAFYSYIGKGLGRPTGFGAAYVAILTYLAEVIAVYGLLGGGVASLFDSWGINVPWWVGALAACVVVALLGHRNVDLSKKVLGTFLILEAAIVIALDIAVFSTGGAHGISTGIITPSTIMSGAPGLALLFAFLSFLGFEATAVYRDEARNPDRTVPRATYLAVILIGIFYVVSTWALISAWGDVAALKIAKENPVGMLPEATSSYLGVVAAQGVQVLFVTSLFACVLSFHNIVSRYVFTLSNRRAMPTFLGKAHAAHGSPYVASFVEAIVSAVFIMGAAAFGLDPVNQLYTWFAGATTVGFIVLLLATTLAVLVFFTRLSLRGQLKNSVWRVFVGPAFALAGLAGVFWLVLQNLPGLVGNSTPLAIGIVCLLFATAIGGAVFALLRPKLSLED